MWKEIVNENGISSFMNEMCGFHDSCIKEIQYISGAYVKDNLSMHPVNDKRILSVIIQRQFEDIPVIELQFSGLKYLKMHPLTEKYTCEIFDSVMFFKDDCIYWCDSGDVTEDDSDEYEGTLICATKLRWRSVENKLGEDDFYIENSR